jgi:hypothetical protein
MGLHLLYDGGDSAYPSTPALCDVVGITKSGVIAIGICATAKGKSPRKRWSDSFI